MRKMDSIHFAQIESEVICEGRNTCGESGWISKNSTIFLPVLCTGNLTSVVVDVIQINAYSHMGVEPKIGGKPPKIIYFHRVFHYFHHPFLGGFPPIFGLTPICLMDALPPFLERCFLLLWKESDLRAIHGQQTYLDTWLVNWIPGWSTGYLVGQLDTWLVNWIPGWSIGYLVGQLDTWLVNWIPGWSTGYLVGQLDTGLVIFFCP